MRTSTLLSVVGLMLLSVTTNAVAQPQLQCVNVRDFRDQVVDLGGDNEDWQPAFQAAIAQARKTLQPIYVPTSQYKIRKAIEIVPVEVEGTSFVRNNIRMFGDGKYKSVISQEVETENCINWTGLEYKKSATHGSLSNIFLRGGKVTLNIKWHNYFMLDSCYIAGAQEYGVHAEGWSSRFLNSTIRWCRKAGIYAGGVGTFNNCIIRDCYFSRDGIGFHMPNRGSGNRIEGCGFENCSKAAIYLGGTMELGKYTFSVLSFTINNCYFEANGYSDMPLVLPVEGPVSTIHLDRGCKQITIHDCNFFTGRRTSISIAEVVGGHIYDNTINGSIQLRAACETPAGTDPLVSELVVENNSFLRGVTDPLVEEEPGLIEQAISQHCVFRMLPRTTCQGSPVGQLRPQCLGDEILDTQNNVWYKAVGPSKSDWVRLH